MVRPDPSILITCTQPRADIIVHDLESNGIYAIAKPVLTVGLLQSAPPEGMFDAMLITSRHALNADLPTDIPVIAIGEETAIQCRDKGLRVVQTGSDDLKSMNLSPYKSIIYPCARHPSLIPENATPWHVYETFENSDFNIPDTVKTICVFSARAARIIQTKTNTTHQILCLSQSIANIFYNHKIDNLAVCAQPRYDAMKDLIVKRDVRP